MWFGAEATYVQVTPNGRYREEQAYQDSDSRNFDHMNLSGSFVLQSTSCRDLSSGRFLLLVFV
jgi:hypothetical protein